MAVLFVCSVCKSHNEDNDIIVGSTGIYSINGSMNGPFKTCYPALFPFLQVVACPGDHPDNDYSADRTQMPIGKKPPSKL